MVINVGSASLSHNQVGVSDTRNKLVLLALNDLDPLNDWPLVSANDIDALALEAPRRIDHLIAVVVAFGFQSSQRLFIGAREVFRR